MLPLHDRRDSASKPLKGVRGDASEATSPGSDSAWNSASSPDGGRCSWSAVGAIRTLTLDEAAAFLHMHPDEVRTRTKRGLIPGAKTGRRWVFLEVDLAEFVRSLYPVKRQALRVTTISQED